MKRKFLSILLALCMCLTVLPTAALADGPTPIPGESSSTTNPTTPNSGGNGGKTETTGGSTGTSCTHTLGAENKCGNCGKLLIAEVTSTTEDGTATYYLAATGVIKVDTYDVDDFDLIEDAFVNSSTTKVKLLADVATTWGNSAIPFYYPNQTLDLNGHTLDSVGGVISLMLPDNDDPPAPSLTITDTSRDKDGELKACVYVELGSLTINGGKLTAETRMTEDGENYTTTPGPIEITGGSMTVSGTAKVNCSTITVKGTIPRPGSLTVQDNAEITGGIAVNENGTLTMTGGTVTNQSAPSVFVNGGTAKISGGMIGILYAVYGNISLSGGIYNAVIFYDSNSKAVNLLKPGYAFYDASGSPSTGMTKGDLINVRDNIVLNSGATEEDTELSYIMVAPHECEFTTTALYTCDCGRTATQQPIAYVDEDGNTAYCMEYTVLTSPESGPINLNTDGAWYVVPDGFTAFGLAIKGNSHLILPNNTTATLVAGIEDQSDTGKSLSIYGQPAATGETTGKLTVEGNERSGGAICSKSDLTINGGDITVNKSVAITGAEAEHGIINGIYSVAVADKLTVNGGKLTVNTPGLTDTGSIGVYGIYAYDLTVNGGEIKVISSPITAKNGQVSSCGIFTHKLTMTGGEVSATGAAITATYTYDPDGTCDASSAGISVQTVWQDGDTVPGTGAASITGGELTAKGGNVTASGSVPFMSTWSEGLYASELSVANATVEATGGNASLTANQPEGQDVTVHIAMAFSYGLSAGMTVKSGSITAKSGTAAATGCGSASYDARDLYGDLTMQGGTVTDGTAAGNVLANLYNLNMTGGTLKLMEGSMLTSVAASPLNAPLPEGCAYFEVRYDEQYKENNVDFVTLGSQAALNPEMDFNTAYYVKTCTHSTTSGVCTYCGKDFTPTPDPEPTPGPADPDPTPSTPSGGSSGSSNPTVSTETTTTPDGSTVKTETKKDGTVIETVKSPDGSTTKTESKTETKKDGTTVETVKETVTGKDGSTSTSETKTETKADGSSTETKTETTKASDGTKTETKTESKTDKNGAASTTETKKTTLPDGSSSTTTTVTDENGSKTTASVTVSSKAAKGGETVTLPVEVPAGNGGDSSTTVKVTVPAGSSVTVEIPVSNVTAGTVVIIVNADGSETIVSSSKVTENGIEVTLEKSATLKIVDASKQFGDVKDVDFFRDAVQWASSRGITGGIGDGKFGPHLSTERAQLVTMLYRFALAAGVDMSAGENTNILSYADALEVPEYAIAALQWAVGSGILQGADGKLMPGHAITREQMAVILYRFAQAVGMDTTQGGMAAREFADYDSVADYAREAMQWAVGAGIIQGADGKLLPGDVCTRGQIVTMLYRLLGR